MKVMILLIMISLLPIPVFAKDLRDLEVQADYVPPPALIYPIGGEVSLGGKSVLQFKWSPHEGAGGGRDYYDFRLYKGYQMVESALFLKEKLAGDMYQYNISSDRFRENEVYTWALRQIYNPLRKSGWRYISFRVIKK